MKPETSRSRAEFKLSCTIQICEAIEFNALCSIGVIRPTKIHILNSYVMFYLFLGKFAELKSNNIF